MKYVMLRNFVRLKIRWPAMKCCCACVNIQIELVVANLFIVHMKYYINFKYDLCRLGIYYTPHISRCFNCKSILFTTITSSETALCYDRITYIHAQSVISTICFQNIPTHLLPLKESSWCYVSIQSVFLISETYLFVLMRF